MTTAPVDAVFVAQMPPPVHGQAQANALLAASSFTQLRLAVVPMQVSEDIEDVGRFRAGKVLRLAAVLGNAWRARRRTGAEVLVYSVGLGNRVALARDVAALLVLRRGFSRTVLHVHTGAAGEVVEGVGWPLRPLAHRAYGNAAVLYLDRSLGGDGQGLPRPASVGYLPYGIPDPCPDGPSRNAPERGGRPPVVLFVGNLYDSKGTIALIDAAGELAEAGVSLRVAVVGADPDGTTMARLRARAEACGAGGCVDLLGARYGAEKERLFAEADLFCFPTMYEAEGMPLVVLEAMAHGLPVLSTPWRAIPSMVVEGETGRLVPPGDAHRLAVALRDMLADPEELVRMGDRGRQRFLEHFTADRFARRFEALVLEACDIPTGEVRSPADTLDNAVT